MSQAGTLLLVESDATLRAALAEQLEAEPDFRVVEAGTGPAALAAAAAGAPDVVIIDAPLAGMEARDLLDRLRAGSARPSVLLLGEAAAGAGEGAGVERLAKPFRISTLLARLRALLRARAQSEEAALAIGSYSLRPGLKALIDAEGRRIRLTEKETGILARLHRAGGETVSRETLLHEVWGYNDGVTTHTLETHVYRLRQKIERDPAAAELLLTEPGGYRLAL